MSEQLEYMGALWSTAEIGTTLTDAVSQSGPWKVDDNTPQEARCSLSGAASGAGQAEIPERPLRALSSILVARVYDLGSVTYRLISGGVDYYHDGAAWVAATDPAHVNTGAEVEAAIGDWAFDSLGLRVYLPADTDHTTAAFYGLRAMLAIRWAAVQADPLRGAGPFDDLIFRTIKNQLLNATNQRQWWVTREVDCAEEITSVDFDFATIGAEQPSTVLDAVAFDTTDDPGLRTPLGAFDIATKTLDLSATPIPSGHRRLDRYRIEPKVYYSGDRAITIGVGPAIVLENAREIARRTRGGRFIVARGGDVWGVDNPNGYDWQIGIRLIADSPMDLVALRASVRRAIVDAEWQSPNTGQRASVELLGGLDIGQGEHGALEARGEIVILDWQVWEGDLKTSSHTTEDGFTLQTTDTTGENSWPIS